MRPRLSLAQVDTALRGGLVVSCQPVDGGPMDDDEVVCRMARAAVAGGAAGLRLAGAQRVARVREAVTVPVIGIVKRDLPGSDVRITPLLQDVQDLLDAGADVIALDATQRPRHFTVPELLERVRAGRAVAMADASCLDDGRTAQALGFDIVGSTLSGYMGGPVPTEPDLELVSALAREGMRVMAEGRFNTPAKAAAALQAGAWAVTVGSALTRLEVATAWFREALDGSLSGTRVSASNPRGR